ncbi:MAG TPA: hypothetical protein VHP33_07795 [Polyangiaceae bacterium]|nr:hypothetical protein [Polyangiaceae bacterium]
MFQRAVWMGLFTGVLAVACDDSNDRVSGDGSRGQAAAGTAGADTSASGDSKHGGDGGTETGGSSGTATGGGSSGNDAGGSSGTATGGESGQAGTAGGDTGVPDKCELGPEIYDDDSPSASSTAPCGRLGDLSVTPGFALDVGHATDILLLRRTATRVLSYDGRWVLWDVEARRMLKQGHVPRQRDPDPFTHLPNPQPPVLSDTHLAALASTDGLAFDLEIASALDGEVVATVTMPGLGASSHFGFASDDSYLWATTEAGVSAWSTDGHLLAETSGNYVDASVSAVPGELRIALPTRDVIETISTVTGDSTVSPAFEGDFHSWFVEGTRFLTTTSNTVRVYSGATVTQENIFTVATLKDLTGQGDHVWTYDEHSPEYTLDIYALSDPSAPAASYHGDVFDKPFPAGNRIGILKHGVPRIDMIELGPTITQSSVDVPSYYNNAFTADDAGNWAIGGRDGELFESTDLTHPLSCGRVLSIARADDGTTAVATAAGGIHLFKLTADSRQYLSTIPFTSGHVELSRDGLVLAASANLNNYQYQKDNSLRVFSLPDGDEIKTWPYSFPDPSSADARFFGFSMSSQGNRFGHETGVFDSSYTYTRQVRDLDDNVSLVLTESVNDLSVEYDGHLRLSADGTLVAVTAFDPNNNPTRRGDSTSVYENGVLINTFRGNALAWFDDDRLLIELDGAWRVVDSSGHLEPAPEQPADYGYGDGDAQIVSASEVYSPDQGAIYSLTTGEKLWTCDRAWSIGYAGRAAANYVVFVSDQAAHKVVFDGY